MSTAPGRILPDAFPLNNSGRSDPADDGRILAADRDMSGSHIQRRRAKRVRKLHAHAASANAGPHDHAGGLIVESARGRSRRGGRRSLGRGWLAGRASPPESSPSKAGLLLRRGPGGDPVCIGSGSCSILRERQRTELYGYGEYPASASQILQPHGAPLYCVIRQLNSCKMQLSEHSTSFQAGCQGWRILHELATLEKTTLSDKQVRQFIDLMDMVADRLRPVRRPRTSTSRNARRWSCGRWRRSASGTP